MRPLMRSNAPLRTCGPGTRIMHGQTATRRSDELNWYRTASAPITPASNDAQNGCRKTFALYCAKLRRRRAPAPALTNMSAAAARCWTPKITANATAPAAAARVNSHVGADGVFEILVIDPIAAAGASRPAPSSSIARIVEATRSISTPAGSASTAEINLAGVEMDRVASTARHD